jgi:hypothetical protein
LVFAIIVLYFVYKLCVWKIELFLENIFLFNTLPSYDYFSGAFLGSEAFLPLILTGIIIAYHHFKFSRDLA